jgi:hypothetical protein
VRGAVQYLPSALPHRPGGEHLRRRHVRERERGFGDGVRPVRE